MEKKRAKSLLMNGLMFAVGFIIIGIMISFIGAENVIQEMSKADPFLVILAVVLMFIVLTIKLVRWWILLAEASFPNASRVYLIGQTMNLFAPIGTGEVMRAAIAKNKLGIKARETMAAVVIERLADITFLAAITCIGVVMFVPGRENYIFMLLLAAIIAVVFVLLVKPQLFDRLALFVERIFEKRGRFLSKLSLKIALSMTKFKEAILRFHKRKAALGAHIVITVVSWMLEAMVTYILLLALGGDPPFILFILVINATSWVVRTFLFLPVGPKEVTFIFLMGQFGIEAELAGAVALIILALSYIVLGSGALVSIVTFGKTQVPMDDKEEESDSESKNSGEGEKEEEQVVEAPSSEDEIG